MPKLAKHCHITKYLKNSTKENAKFVEIADDLCVLGFLRPLRMFKGVTVIIPDKKTIQRLDKLSFAQTQPASNRQQPLPPSLILIYFSF